MSEKYYIEIGGKVYQCRVINGKREVFFNGQFNPAENLVEYLQSSGDLETVYDLALFGREKLKEELKQ